MDIFKVNGLPGTNYFYFHGEMVIGLGFLRHGEKIQRPKIESKTAESSLSHRCKIATVLATFVAIGGDSSGNATKLPLPATALIAPPSAPEKNETIACCEPKPEFYHKNFTY